MLGRRHCAKLSEAIDAFLDDLAVSGRAASTIGLYRQLLAPLAHYLKEARLLISVKRSEVVAYLSLLKQRGDSDSYVGLNARVFKRFFAWNAEQGIVGSNPLRTLRPGVQRWQPVAPFTREEVARLLAAAETPLERATLLLLLDTGLRASELAGLRLAQIDLAGGEIRVKGKGDRLRVVALNEIPRQALEQYLNSHGSTDGCLWPDGWDRTKVARVLDGLGRRAGVARVYPHRCRHTWATWALRGGIDPLALKSLGGWTSLKMVERYTAAEESNRAVSLHRQHPIITL